MSRHTQSKGLGDKAEELFFKAYFTDGKNVSDDATLVELGNDIGLSESDVNEALSNPLYAGTGNESPLDNLWLSGKVEW